MNSQPAVAFINNFNPLYYFIDLFRDLVVYHSIPETKIITGVLILTFGTLIIGKTMYEKSEKNIHDLLKKINEKAKSNLSS